MLSAKPNRKPGRVLAVFTAYAVFATLSAHAEEKPRDREVRWDFSASTLAALQAPSSDAEYSAYLKSLSSGFAAAQRKNVEAIADIQSDPELKVAHTQCLKSAAASGAPWSGFTNCVNASPLADRGLAGPATEIWRWYFMSLAAPGFCEKKLGKPCPVSQSQSIANAKGMATKWIAGGGVTDLPWCAFEQTRTLRRHSNPRGDAIFHHSARGSEAVLAQSRSHRGHLPLSGSPGHGGCGQLPES